MIKTVFEALRREISGEIAFKHVSEISNHHRIQASPGIREAVGYVSKTLEEYGLNTNTRRYKASYGSQYWSSRMFNEWDCSEAELNLVGPKNQARVLARFSDCKISVIQRSHPTSKEGVEAEVVVLNKGEDERDYKDLDVRGKVVLTNGDVMRVYYLAVEGHGALGIIYDGMFSREYKPDDPLSLTSFYDPLDSALKYTSFWWYEKSEPCWGFVLSPKAGRWLKQLIQDSKTPVKVHAVVKSKFYQGEIEDQIATISGETDEMVIVAAHICHPQPSANDNASGSGAAMEAARALHKLIESGRIKKPKRKIVFTLIPEMVGTYPWLAENEEKITNMLAALNLDMVGENQNLCGGPLIMERTPESCPSYVNSLIEAIYDEVKAEVKNLSGSASYPLFKHAITPFSGGSDHYIYSDPTVGVPCPMIIQWPDRFYHTSWDTIDKVDPEMLRKVALITATYAYFIADAGSPESIWLADETAYREKAGLLTKMRAEANKAIESETNIANDILLNLSSKVEYWADIAAKSVRSTTRLAPDYADLEQRVKELIKNIYALANTEERRAKESIIGNLKARGIKLPQRRMRRSKLENVASKVVPKRSYRGPISTRQWTMTLNHDEREKFYQFVKLNKDYSNLDTLALYWADGERSVLDISRLVDIESGKTNTKYLLEYFQWLARMRLVYLR